VARLLGVKRTSDVRVIASNGAWIGGRPEKARLVIQALANLHANECKVCVGRNGRVK